MALNRPFARLSGGSVWGPAGPVGHAMQRALRGSYFHFYGYRQDLLSLGLTAVHLGVLAYVLVGWMSNSRLMLFFYVLLLPILALQWLFNHGSSVVTNYESYLRTGHWRDPHNVDEGHFLQNLVERSTGLRPTSAQMMVVTYSLMFMFWQAALLRMMMVIPN